ncbi:MAG TPA: serine/threonine-protein kinase [Streptosporangiaceae bacterium]
MRVQDAAPERLGPYRLVRRLGEGGMGVVYLAVDDSGSSVAVKALHPGMAQEENARRRLAREVETMRRVRSQYVAEVLDADLDGSPPYIVTRYVPGLTLDGVVGSAGPLTGPALARLASGLAQALAAVHAAGVVHRDLKPGNVMICDGEPVVIDFGIAQIPETTRLTLTGMFMGTPGYLAPEVIEGKDSGAASDVHSLGATLAFAATGRPPYGTGAFEVIFYRIVHGTPDLDTLPAPLRPIVLAALARDPAARPSATEIASWVAALDPASLVPGPAGHAGGHASGPGDGPAGDGPPGDGNGLVAGPAAGAGPAVGLDSLPRTTMDGIGQALWPGSTRPLDTAAANAAVTHAAAAQAGTPHAVGSDDVRDLLPPVSYQPAGYGPPGYGPPGYGPAGPGPDSGRTPAAGQQPAGGAPAGRPARDGQPDRASRVTSWSPLVFAVVAILVAASLMAPIIGTALALAVLVGLRAATTTGGRLARRRSEGGHRGGDALVAVAYYPIAVLRSLLGLVLLAPVALLGFCVAAAATIIVVPVHPLPRAAALGAGAMVAIIGLGPGSAGSRAALASMFSSAARTPARLTIAYAGVLAIAVWAGISAWAQTSAPAYWPLASLHGQLVHLPTFRHILTDIRTNLLMIARQFGL